MKARIVKFYTKKSLFEKERLMQRVS